MMRAALLVAIAITATATAAEQQSAPVPEHATEGQAKLRGSSGAHGSAPVPSEMPQANGVSGPTDPGTQVPSTTTVPSTTSAAAKSNATESDSTARELSSSWFDWGHGHRGETCCMCSYQFGGPTGTVVIYAAEDYDNFWGGHGAFWHCEHECERKCGGPHFGGHKFGCLDEHHLQSLTRTLRHSSGFRIEHQHKFGNLC
jgi:hypothetical protein